MYLLGVRERVCVGSVGPHTRVSAMVGTVQPVGVIDTAAPCGLEGRGSAV